MVQKQPFSCFTWLNTPSSEKQILEWDVDGDYGCFLEVDLVVPNELHDKFNCFPLAAEHMEITEKIASATSLAIRKKREGSSSFSSTKLAPNLLPKQKYICHIRNLQFYLSQGLQLVGVHRVLRFKQVKKF